MTPDWIAVDWGTSHLRAYAMSNQGEILETARSNSGMTTLAPDQFENVLLEMTASWLDPNKTTPVMACGMIGAKQGWIEAPYRSVPCTPISPETLKAPGSDPRVRVQIISGLSQKAPLDVMRGEETQIAGYLAKKPEFDGVLCLPGTHSKWVRISAGEVVSFVTYMTGELFALLSEKSVLRHSMTEDGWSDETFQDALMDAISKPQQLAARLFSIRAGSLLDDLPPDIARSKLSGALIGIELASAKPYWLGQDVVIIGETELSQAYGSALKAQGLAPSFENAQEMTLAGLAKAYLETPPE